MNRKSVFTQVSKQATKLYALNHVTEVNLSTQKQRYKATFVAEQ